MPWERKTVTKRKMHTAIHTHTALQTTYDFFNKIDEEQQKKNIMEKKYILQEVINYMKKKLLEKKTI